MVRRVYRAGAAVGAELVDHRRVGDAPDNPHRTVAGRTRERVDLE